MLADGDAADLQWIFTELKKGFKCKSEDMGTDLVTRDYLGMVIRIEGDRIYNVMSMAKYIGNACRILKIDVPQDPACASPMRGVAKAMDDSLDSNITGDRLVYLRPDSLYSS